MFWLILLIILGIGILGIYLMQNYHFMSSTAGVGCSLAITAAVILIMVGALWPISYWGTKAEIEVFKATKNTVEISRNNEINALENATLQQKIIEQNQWLAAVQFWNETIFDPVIPNEVMELKPLK